MQVSLSSYNNKWYHSASILKRACWYTANTIIFNNSFFPYYKFKAFLLRAFGAKVGKGVIIKPSVNIKYPWKLQIGDDTWIGENVWIDNLANISIGKNVCISQGALLLTGNHNYKKTTFDLMIAGITIEDGVWIGAKSIVCPGITCSTHSVLSVASVANKNLEPYFIYTGNPAIKIKERIISS